MKDKDGPTLSAGDSARKAEIMTKSSAHCLICGRQPTVRSHLLPRAFVHAIRGDDRYVLLTDRGRPGHRFTQAGTYSDDIFCDGHEAVTGELDRIAIGFCREVYSGGPLRAGSIFEVSNHDPEALIRFTCSILLRCHLSGRDEARDIKLGPYVSVMEDVAFGGDQTRAPDIYVYAAVSEAVEVVIWLPYLQA